jgi:hypothetical protein
MAAADSTLAAALAHCGAKDNPASASIKENRHEQIKSPDDKSS